MKNLLSLHEAIVIALINLDKKEFKATFSDIAAFIEGRNLYPNRKENINLAEQIMLRSTKSNKSCSYLFEEVDSETIKLR